MDDFIFSVDRLLPYCSFCFTDYLRTKLELNYMYNNILENCTGDEYYFPDYYQIYKKEYCIQDEYTEFIEDKYVYVVLNLLSKELFCIDNNLNNVLLSFRKKRNVKEIISTHNDRVNLQLLSNLIYNGLLKTAVKKDNNYLKRDEIVIGNFYQAKGYLTKKKISENAHSIVFLVKKNNKHYILKHFFKSEYYPQKEVILNELHIRKNIYEPDFLAPIIAYDLKSLFIVTEYIQGIDLEVYLIKCNPTIIQKISIIKQVIQIVSKFHINNIIHGDIHLGQFRITVEGEVKLLDLELAVDLNKKHDQVQIAGGAFEYLEPEAITNDPFNFLSLTSKNKQAEIYRLGVLIYVIIYEAFPFAELTWKKLYKSKITQKPEFFSKTPKKEIIPKYIIEILKNCLSLNPNNRYNSCNEIVIR